MRYRLEYHTNPDRMSVHVDKRVTKKMTEVFFSENWDEDKQMPFVRDLFAVDGVSSVSLGPYSIHIEKGGVFQWEEMISRIIFVLQMHFDPNGEAVEAEQPLRYSLDREGYRSDILMGGELHRSRIFLKENPDETSGDE